METFEESKYTSIGGSLCSHRLPAPGSTPQVDQAETQESASARNMSGVGELAEEGGIQPGTSQEHGREPGTGQGGDREPGTGQEGDREPGTGQEGDREPGTSQEGDREPGTGQEGDREPGTGHEGDREPGTGHEGDREPGTGQAGDKEPGTGQEGHKEPGTGQEGHKEPGTGQEGYKEPGTGQEGHKEPGTGQEGDRDQSANQKDDRETGMAEVPEKEQSVVEEEGTNAINEDNFLSQQQREDSTGFHREFTPSKSHYESAEEAVNLEKEELEAAVKTGQQGLYTSEETPNNLHEEQEEDIPPHVDHQMEEVHKPGEDEQSQQDTEALESQREMSEDTQYRESLVQLYHALVLEREKVQQQNGQLQHKLYEYFRRKKGEEARPEIDKPVSDQEQRYLKYLNSMEEMRKKYKADTACHEQQIEELKAQCHAAVSQVDREWNAFQEQKKNFVLYGVSPQGIGKHVTSSFAQEVEQLQSREERKEKEVIQVRLENIKLKNQIQRYESALRSREELAEGLHLIDFEQLKIENQTYNEKIEERNEELLKLRKKITNTVQVLTHLKEKLQFIQAENQEQKERLMEVEALVAYKRDILTKTKQARDSLRMDNLKLKQKSGLLGNKVLLRDFEEKVDATENLSQRLESLKRHHAELTLSSKGITKKIEEAKLVLES